MTGDYEAMFKAVGGQDIQTGPQKTKPLEIGALCKVRTGSHNGQEGIVAKISQLDEDQKSVTLRVSDDKTIVMVGSDLVVLKTAAEVAQAYKAASGPAAAIM